MNPPKPKPQLSLEALLSAILDDDQPKAKELLKSEPALATRLMAEARLCESKIVHWLYAKDTALHLAAAGHRVEIVRLLLAAGADPNAAANHRHGTPLHYAADGNPTCPEWNAQRQVETIRRLLDAGARINDQDKNGATPLHRTVRGRCAAAAQCLLKAGADATLRNKPGSTPFHLAVQNTGRGGTGEEAAKEAQREIIAGFLAFGVNPNLRDGKGQTVFDCARSGWIREALSGKAGERG